MLCGEAEAFWQAAVSSSKEIIFTNARKKSTGQKHVAATAITCLILSMIVTMQEVFLTVSDNAAFNYCVSAYTFSVLSVFSELTIPAQLSFRTTLTIY